MIANNKGVTTPDDTDKFVELTILQVFFFFKKYFLKLIIICFICGSLGVLYSFTKPRTFKAQTVLLPEYARMNERSGFFAMSMSMGGREGAENLYPELYSYVLNSRPFGEFLLNQKMVDKMGKTYPTLGAYFMRDSVSNSGSLIKSIRNLFSNSSTPKEEIKIKNGIPVKELTLEEESKIKQAYSLISLSVNATNGLITINSETEDPIISAIIVDLGRKYLIEYVESYRTEKLANSVEYLQFQLNDIKSKENKAAYAYQSFKDRNQNLYLNTTKIEEERLFSDYKLFASMTEQISGQLEQTKLKLKQERPVFKELEPVIVPTVKSGPNRMLLGILFAIGGGFITILYLLFVTEKIHNKLLFR